VHELEFEACQFVEVYNRRKSAVYRGTGINLAS